MSVSETPRENNTLKNTTENNEFQFKTFTDINELNNKDEEL